MANKRPKPEEIVVKLRQVEVLMGQGMPRIDAIRQIGVTEQTYYRWKKKYGGMGTEQLKELKRLQKENERLRRAVSDLTLDKLILSEAAKGVRGVPETVIRPFQPRTGGAPEPLAPPRLHRSCAQPNEGFRASCLPRPGPAPIHTETRDGWSG